MVKPIGRYKTNMCIQTFPKTNSRPLKISHICQQSVSQPPFVWGRTVSFREGIWPFRPYLGNTSQVFKYSWWLTHPSAKVFREVWVIFPKIGLKTARNHWSQSGNSKNTLILWTIHLTPEWIQLVDFKNQSQHSKTTIISNHHSHSQHTFQLPAPQSYVDSSALPILRPTFSFQPPKTTTSQKKTKMFRAIGFFNPQKTHPWCWEGHPTSWWVAMDFPRHPRTWAAATTIGTLVLVASRWWIFRGFSLLFFLGGDMGGGGWGWWEREDILIDIYQISECWIKLQESDFYLEASYGTIFLISRSSLMHMMLFHALPWTIFE